MTLNSDQESALEVLKSNNNVFLTGAAGSGKSFLLRHYLKNKDTPILASTGAAAILVGGRTFHSFFGLGIMEGGQEATVDRALRNKRLIRRLKKAECIVIDEISMISGPTLATAEEIARKTRNTPAPWGGIRIVAVGDFAQLPPVNPHSRNKEWAFLSETWKESYFESIILKKIMRSTDQSFLKILNEIRNGNVDQDVKSFLDSKTQKPSTQDFTRLFAHRADVESYNLQQLEQIDGPIHTFQTTYAGSAKDIENFKKNSPIPDVIQIKLGALIMLRQNDPEGRWVNGSLGHVEKISDEKLHLRLDSGRYVQIEKAEFTLLDADGQPVVSASNFPINLAWAMTIHKAQGATLDRMLVDLRRVWEPGQAYVALSRARDPKELYLDGWSAKAIFADPQVAQFHESLSETH